MFHYVPKYNVASTMRTTLGQRRTNEVGLLGIYIYIYAPRQVMKKSYLENLYPTQAQPTNSSIR